MITMEKYAEQKVLFRLFDVDFKITPRTWQMVVMWIALGLGVAFVSPGLHDSPLLMQLGWGITNGVLAVLSYSGVHLAGHILT